jgi:hypothetical protein
LKQTARQFYVVNKFNTKRSVRLLFDSAGVKQVDMCDDLNLNEATLSRELNPSDDLDGFVYHYHRIMGWLCLNAPSVFIAIDSLTQTNFRGWREPQQTCSESPDLQILSINRRLADLMDANALDKPVDELRALGSLVISEVEQYLSSLNVESVDSRRNGTR